MRRAEVKMGAPSLASCTFLLDANLMEVPSGLIKSHLKNTCITSSQRLSIMTSQFWVVENISPILAKTPNITAKKLK
jgi:hypothetical protein